jgi:predicted PurR-regulated permease PerM
MLTIAVSPVIGWFRRLGAPMWLGVTSALLAVYAILISLGAALVVSAARLADLLPTYQAQFDKLLAGARAGLSHLGISQQQVHTAVGSADLGRLAGVLEGFLGAVAGVLTNAVFVLALLLFMGLDAARFPAQLRATGEQRPDIVKALAAFAHGTRQYLTVTTVFGLIVAVIDALALWPLGIPLPVTWGLLSFITNYIPNVGFIIGVIPPALLGLLEGGPRLMLLVIVVYSLINFVIQSIIQPRFIGNAVGLSATLAFLSLIVWAWILGPLGALLAIPLSLLARGLLIDIDPTTRWIDPLISSGPVAGSGPLPDSDPAPGPPAAHDPAGQPAPTPSGPEHIASTGLATSA